MRTVALSVLAVAALSLSLKFSSAADGDWNQFRGPNQDGNSDATGLPLKFSDGSPEIMWKTPVSGRAWSSPVVWGEQVWLTNAPEIVNPEGATNQNSFSKNDKALEQPIRLSAMCLDLATGKILHDVTVFEIDKPQYTHPTNSYASPTPWIEDGRLYVHFGSYGTAAIDTATGKKVWENTELHCHHWRGPGSSPVVHGDLIYVTFDGYDEQFIAAINKKTGKTAWKRDRDINYGTDNGDAKKAYSTPRVIKVGGRDLVISPFAMATIAYDAKSGEPVWTVRHGGMNASARPLVGHGLVYINAGDGKNALVAIRPDGKGDITATNIEWSTGNKTPKRPSQLLVGDNYFMCNDEGIFSCLDAKTGENIWSSRVSGRYWASPIYADGHIYVPSQDGMVVVFKAAREFELVAENKLDAGMTASPAVAGKSLLIRTEKSLYRIAKP